ncbi:YcxB family protein [Pectinatus haikarae]|uniref:YcxB-like protein domain-containing protein n=1 Tax=Pectinatus haikarae TaxID=349096 RepID=A0ABT9YCB1_9FIRM|nr:YcxB family protein [Pectinatus haikarae]MDQ0205156.1 hypothetical protein [Pectinatus haikarae]
MKTKIIIESTLTRELCMAAAKHMVWHNAVFIFFLCIGILLTLTVPIFIAAGYSAGGAFTANAGFLPGLALTAVILCAPWYIGKNMYQKDGGQRIKMTFDDMQVGIEAGEKRIQLPYGEIKKYAHNEKYLFVFTKGPDAVMYVLPKANFTDVSFPDFLSFLNEKI